MKNFIAFAVLLSLLFFCACQENITTAPGTNLTKINKEIIRDKIPICCEVCDPLSGVCRLNGCVEYTHQIILSPDNPDGLYTIQLNLQMLSQLCDKCMMVHLDWIIRGHSEETVNVSEEGIALVTKYYEITNRFDVQMKIIYLVTTEGAGIAEIMIVPMQPLSNNIKDL